MWGVQAAWRLGQWRLLDEYVQGAIGEGNRAHMIDSTIAFDINLAKVLLTTQGRDSYAFSKTMIQARHELLAPLAAASMESYSRAYPLIIKLHMLHELEIFQECFAKDGLKDENLGSKLQDMVQSWEARIRVTQPSLWAREPILALHRLILSASNMQVEAGSCWLQFAKLCRVAGHYETANRAILEAQSSGAPNAHIELAKLYWDTKKSHRAIAELQQALSKVPVQVLGGARKAALGGLLHIPSCSSTAGEEPSFLSESQRNNNLDTAKTLLLLARCVHSTGQKQKEDVLSMYIRVKELQPKWEKSYFYLARYCDDLLTDAKKRQEECQQFLAKQQSAAITASKVDEKPWWSLLPDVVLYYAKGLHKGHHRLFQALPRLLTLWFEFGSSCHEEILSSNAAIKSTHARVCVVMIFIPFSSSN
jgi:serine/threonine-protein kinase ATR